MFCEIQREYESDERQAGNASQRPPEPRKGIPRLGAGTRYSRGWPAAIAIATEANAVTG